MYVVAGVSGQTGAATAHALLARNLPLRVIVRDAEKGKAWTEKGADVAVADLGDAAALTTALNGASAAYLLNPPAYGAEDPFSVAEVRAKILAQAISQSDVGKVVVLSSISAHLPEGNGIIHTNHIVERTLGDLSKPVTFLRPGYFFENWAHGIEIARVKGILPTMLAPLTKAVPMVAVADIGSLAAKLMQETWIGRRVVELAGPTNTAPETVASLLGEVLGKPVKPVAVPRLEWLDIFIAGGMSHRTAQAFVKMFDGFNGGAIRFEGGEPRRGRTSITEALGVLLTTDH